MRGIWVWLAATLVGVLVLTGVVAAVGNADNSGTTVSASDWADQACGAVGTWRGEMEAIVEDIRTPPSVGQPTEEPQSETPQGRTGFVRAGLERAVRATETLALAFDNSGTPDTTAGVESKQRLTSWANQSLEDLSSAQDSLDSEADTLEESLSQFTTATGALASTLVSGTKVFVEIAANDQELGKALQDSATCQLLREEQSSS